jgi:NAD(P)H dehydrogenase (quinone)
VRENPRRPGAALGRQVSYVPEEVDAWNENYVDSALAGNPHVAEHLKTLTRLIDQLETLLGHRPKTVRWALENHPRIRKVATA